MFNLKFNLKKALITASALMWLAVSVAPKLTVSAQSDPVIMLDNATPSVDIIITPTNGATGAVYMELEGAAVALLDAGKNQVLSAAHANISTFGFQLVANALPHVLHLERLAGVNNARIHVIARDVLPQVNLNALAVAPVSLTNNNTALNGLSQLKTSVTAKNTVMMNISASANMLTAQFAPQDTTFQVKAADGAVVASGKGGQQITSLAIALASGQYSLDLSASGNVPSEMMLSLSTAPAITMTKLAATSTAPAVITATSPALVAQNTCKATVSVASANLYSGPGTAYTVLGVASQGTVLAVGGVNTAGGWVLVQGQASGAWISQQQVTASGNCSGLTAYDIPVQNANTQSSTTVNTNTTGTTNTVPPERGERHEHH